MAVSLGGVELHETMYLKRPYRFSRLAGIHRRSIGGRLLVHQGMQILGEPMDLVGKATLSQLESLRALEDSGGDMALVYNGTTFTVRFRVPEYPHVAFDRVEDVTGGDDDGDWYYGVVKLVTV